MGHLGIHSTEYMYHYNYSLNTLMLLYMVDIPVLSVRGVWALARGIRYFMFVFLEFLGKANLRLEEEKSGIGEIQVCSGLQNQGAEKADRAKRKRHQGV